MPIADRRLPIALSIDDCRSERRLRGVENPESAIVDQSAIGDRQCNRQSAIGLRQ